MVGIPKVRFGGRIDADPITQAAVNLELIAAQHAVAPATAY